MAPNKDNTRDREAIDNMMFGVCVFSSSYYSVSALDDVSLPPLCASQMREGEKAVYDGEERERTNESLVFLLLEEISDA